MPTQNIKKCYYNSTKKTDSTTKRLALDKIIFVQIYTQVRLYRRRIARTGIQKVCVLIITTLRKQKGYKNG